MKFLCKLLILLIIDQVDRRSLIRLKLRLEKIMEQLQSGSTEEHELLNIIVELFSTTHVWYKEEKIKKYFKRISWIEGRMTSEILISLTKIDKQLETLHEGRYFVLRFKKGEEETVSDNSLYFGEREKGKNIAYFKKLACPDEFVNEKIIETATNLSIVLVPEIDKLIELIRI